MILTLTLTIGSIIVITTYTLRNAIADLTVTSIQTIKGITHISYKKDKYRKVKSYDMVYLMGDFNIDVDKWFHKNH